MQPLTTTTSIENEGGPPRLQDAAEDEASMLGMLAAVAVFARRLQGWNMRAEGLWLFFFNLLFHEISPAVFGAHLFTIESASTRAFVATVALQRL